MIMAATRRMLPDLSGLDADALRALILAQQEELASRDTEIENLKLLVLKLKRLQFGQKSEKLDKQIEQLELRLEDLEANQTAAPAFRIYGRTTSKQTGTQAVARALTARDRNLCSPAAVLSGLRRVVAAVRRRRFRNSGVCSGTIQSDPASASEAELQRV